MSQFEFVTGTGTVNFIRASTFLKFILNHRISISLQMSTAIVTSRELIGISADLLSSVLAPITS